MGAWVGADGCDQKTNLALICDLRIYVPLVSQCEQTIQGYIHYQCIMLTLLIMFLKYNNYQDVSRTAIAWTKITIISLHVILCESRLYYVLYYK